MTTVLEDSRRRLQALRNDLEQLTACSKYTQVGLLEAAVQHIEQTIDCIEFVGAQP